jgi:hypothetical protein
MLKRPADEAERAVGWRFGGDVRVRVEPVQGADAREREIAEDVLGDQRRAEQQRDVREHDRDRDRGQRQRARDGEHEQVARAQRQHQQLEAAARDADAETLQRPGQPPGPAADTSGHVLRRALGCAGGDQENSDRDAEQSERAEGARERRADAGVAGAIDTHRGFRADMYAGHGGCSLYAFIVASARRASVQAAR